MLTRPPFLGLVLHRVKFRPGPFSWPRVFFAARLKSGEAGWKEVPDVEAGALRSAALPHRPVTLRVRVRACELRTVP